MFHVELEVFICLLVGGDEQFGSVALNDLTCCAPAGKPPCCCLAENMMVMMMSIFSEAPVLPWTVLMVQDR